MSHKSVSETDLKVLDLISSHEIWSQRELSKRAHLSLGLINLVLRRLGKAGYISIKALDGRKMKYVLTPKGLAEKTNRAYSYLSRTIKIYRQMLGQLHQLIEEQLENGYQKFVLVGEGDVAELVKTILLTKESSIQLREFHHLGDEQISKDEIVLNCERQSAGEVPSISVLEKLQQEWVKV